MLRLDCTMLSTAATFRTIPRDHAMTSAAAVVARSSIESKQSRSTQARGGVATAFGNLTPLQVLLPVVPRRAGATSGVDQ